MLGCLGSVLVCACDVIADVLLHFNRSQSHFNNHNNNNKLSCRLQLPPRTRTPGVCARDRAFGRVELCSYYFIEVDIEIVFFIFFFLIGLSRVACLVVIPLLSISSLCFFHFLILLNCVHINNVCTN